MRSAWPFFAGVIFAVLVTLANVPVMLAVGLGMAAFNRMGEDSASLGGGSEFSVRDDHGRNVSRLANTTYSIITVPLAGEPRPKRLLARLRVLVGESGEGQASLDVWPMGGPAEIRKPPLYSVRAQAHAAMLGEDSMFWTERGGRRTAYSLADGARLFDADLPLTSFSFDPDIRRMAALAVAEEEFTVRGGVAVISYAAPGRNLRRVVLVADDAIRANTIRASISATKLVTYVDEALGGRVLDLPLAAGSVRIPLSLTDMDLARAKMPAGLRLIPLTPWGGG